jgi:hypothetical protein
VTENAQYYYYLESIKSNLHDQVPFVGDFSDCYECRVNRVVVSTRDPIVIRYLAECSCCTTGASRLGGNKAEVSPLCCQSDTFRNIAADAAAMAPRADPNALTGQLARRNEFLRPDAPSFTPATASAPALGRKGIPCRFHLLGTCMRGKSCAFSHEAPRQVVQSGDVSLVVCTRLCASSDSYD